MDGTEVGVLEEVDLVGLISLLEGKDVELVAVLAGDLTDETLKGELPDQELGGLLEATDLTESDGAKSKVVGLLDARGDVLGLLGCCSLVSDVLPGVLGAGVLASRMLGAGYFVCFNL